MKFVITVGVIVFAFVILVGSYAKTLPISIEDQNMDIVKLSFYAFRDGDWASFADLHSADYLQHSPGYDDPITWSEYELSARIVHARLPDLRIRIVDIFAVEDRVAVRSIWEYRNKSYRFRRHYPDGIAQGSEISIFRIKDSMIIEEWCEHDPKPVKSFCTVYKSLERMK